MNDGKPTDEKEVVKKRLYAGQFNYMSQEPEYDANGNPTGNLIVRLSTTGESNDDVFVVSNLYGKDEQIVKTEKKPAIEPHLKERILAAKESVENVGTQITSAGGTF